MHNMKQSSARRTFKRNFGQANHFLVTCLVGLHTLENSDIIRAPVDLHAAWSPKDKASSISRSKHFVLQSFLGWAVDSLDTYLGLLNRRPQATSKIANSKHVLMALAARYLSARRRMPVTIVSPMKQLR